MTGRRGTSHLGDFLEMRVEVGAIDEEKDARGAGESVAESDAEASVPGPVDEVDDAGEARRVRRGGGGPTPRVGLEGGQGHAGGSAGERVEERGFSGAGGAEEEDGAGARVARSEAREEKHEEEEGQEGGGEEEEGQGEVFSWEMGGKEF